jgi:hypothetical protein
MGKLRAYCALAAACLCVMFAQSTFANSLSDNYLDATWAPSRHMGHSLRGGTKNANTGPVQPNNPIQLITDSTQSGKPQSGPAIADLTSHNVGGGAAASNHAAEPPDGSFNPPIDSGTGWESSGGEGLCPNPRPDVVHVYNTPEPSAVIILLADLLLFGTAAIGLRRRGILSART